MGIIEGLNACQVGGKDVIISEAQKAANDINKRPYVDSDFIQALEIYVSIEPKNLQKNFDLFWENLFKYLSNKQQDLILVYVLEKQFLYCKDPNQRLQSVCLVNAFFKSVDANIYLSKTSNGAPKDRISIVVSLSNELCDRLNDKVAKIRTIAAESLQQFSLMQVEGKLDIGVIQHLLDSVQDTNKDFRFNILYALESVSDEKYVTPTFIWATADDSPQIRKQTYTWIKMQIPIENMTSKQISQLIENGFDEKEATVKESFYDMIIYWYMHWCDQDLDKFQTCIQTEKDFKKGTQILYAFIEKEVLTVDKIIDKISKNLLLTPKSYSAAVQEGDTEVEMSTNCAVLWFSLVTLASRVAKEYYKQRGSGNSDYQVDGEIALQDNPNSYSQELKFDINNYDQQDVMELEELLDLLIPESQVEMLDLIKYTFDKNMEVVTLCLLSMALESIEFSDAQTQTKARELFEYLTGVEAVKRIDVSAVNQDLKLRYKQALAKFAYAINGQDTNETFKYALEYFLSIKDHVIASEDLTNWLSQVNLVLEILRQVKQFPLKSNVQTAKLLMEYMQDIVFLALDDQSEDGPYRIKTIEMVNRYALIMYPNFTDIPRFLPTVCMCYLLDSINYATVALEGLQDILCMYSPATMNSILKTEFFGNVFSNQDMTPNKTNTSVEKYFMDQQQSDFGILICSRILAVLQEQSSKWSNFNDRKVRSKSRTASQESFTLAPDATRFLETSFWALFKILTSDLHWQHKQTELLQKLKTPGISKEQELIKQTTLKSYVGSLSKDSVCICITVMLIMTVHPIFGEGAGGGGKGESTFQKVMSEVLAMYGSACWRNYSNLCRSLLVAARIATIFEKLKKVEKLVQDTLHKGITILEQSRLDLVEYQEKELKKKKGRSARRDGESPDESSEPNADHATLHPPQGLHYTLVLQTLSELAITKYDCQTSEYVMDMFLILLNIKLDHERLNRLQIQELHILLNDILIDDQLSEANESDPTISSCLKQVQKTIGDLSPHEQLSGNENVDHEGVEVEQMEIVTVQNNAKERQQSGLFAHFPNMIANSSYKENIGQPTGLKLEFEYSPEATYTTRTRTGRAKKPNYVEQL